VKHSSSEKNENNKRPHEHVWQPQTAPLSLN